MQPKNWDVASFGCFKVSEPTLEYYLYTTIEHKTFVLKEQKKVLQYTYASLKIVPIPAKLFTRYKIFSLQTICMVYKEHKKIQN